MEDIDSVQSWSPSIAHDTACLFQTTVVCDPVKSVAVNVLGDRQGRVSISPQTGNCDGFTTLRLVWKVGFCAFLLLCLELVTYPLDILVRIDDAIAMRIYLASKLGFEIFCHFLFVTTSHCADNVSNDITLS